MEGNNMIVMNSGLSHEDAQDKDDWKLTIKWKLTNQDLPGKWPLKRSAYVKLS